MFCLTEKIQKKYGALGGELLLLELQKGTGGLGLSLAGNKDRTRMSVFVCGLNPQGNAYKDGRIRTGDEILEVRPASSNSAGTSGGQAWRWNVINYRRHWLCY